MTVDPVDDCTFWYTNEYLKANGTFNWSTLDRFLQVPGCGGSTTPVHDVAVASVTAPSPWWSITRKPSAQRYRTWAHRPNPSP